MSLAMQTNHGLSARAACRALGLSRSAGYYRPRACNDEPIIEVVSAHIGANPGHGFGLLYKTLRAGTLRGGKTRLHRVYGALKPTGRRGGRRPLPARFGEPLVVPPRLNETWSADFMSEDGAFAPST